MGKRLGALGAVTAVVALAVGIGLPAADLPPGALTGR
jgi:hypothetical protein